MRSKSQAIWNNRLQSCQTGHWATHGKLRRWNWIAIPKTDIVHLFETLFCSVIAVWRVWQDWPWRGPLALDDHVEAMRQEVCLYASDNIVTHGEVQSGRWGTSFQGPRAVGVFYLSSAGSRKHHRSSRDREAVLPGHTKLRLHDLFRDVEKEFEALYLENVQLKERIAALERANQVRELGTGRNALRQTTLFLASPNRHLSCFLQSDVDPSLFCAQLSLAGISEKDLKDDHDEKNVLKSFTKNKAIKTRHKLKAHTSKIVSSFKAPTLVCSLSKEFKVRKLNLTTS